MPLKESKVGVLNSAHDPLTKIVYRHPRGGEYYAVSFYDTVDNSLNICSSSQVGCIEDCRFCATGGYPFRSNLSAEQISSQHKDGVSAMDSFRQKHRIELLYIIMEGMGEPSFNLMNCLQGLELSYQDLVGLFRKIIFRISTIGNTALIDPYRKFIQDTGDRMPHVDFQFQISLHTPFNHERAWLIPKFGARLTVEEVLKRFYVLSDYLGDKLKCNYLLMNYPDGGNNYSRGHIDQLIRVVVPEKTRIKLTRYSDTGKGFSSPPEEVYDEVREALEQNGIQTKVRKIMGADVNAACGMLHYERPSS